MEAIIGLFRRIVIERGGVWIARRWTLVNSVIVSFAVVGLQLAQGILLARLLAPQGRGEYATVVFWSHLLMYIGLFGGLELICRYANDVTVDRLELRRSALWLGLVTGAISTLLAVLGSLFLLPGSKQFLAPVAAVCSLSVLAQNVILIITAVDRGSGAFQAFNRRRIFAASALPLLMLLAVPFVRLNVTWVAILYVLGSYLVMGLCLSDIGQPFRGKRAIPLATMLRESTPYGIAMLAADLFERLDTLLVVWLVPFVAQGYYAAMVPVVYPLIVIPNTVGIFLFNLGAKGHAQLTRRGLTKTLALLMSVQAVMTVAFMLVADPLIRWVYGEEFSNAVEIALWLAPVSAIKGVVQGLEGFLKGRGRPGASILCRVMASIVMIATTLAWYPTHGITAIAVAALIGQIVCLLWVSRIVYGEIPSSLPEN